MTKAGMSGVARPGAGRPRLPISVSLSLLVAVVLAPALGFGAFMLDRYAAAERAGNSAAAENAASRAADAIDRELAGMLATLNTLAALPALRADDLGEFRLQSAAAMAGTRRVLVVTAADGHELFRSAGSPHPVDWKPAPSEREASNLLADGDDRFVRIGVTTTSVPAMSLFFELPAPVLAGVLGLQRFPRDWVVSLVDGADLVISRTEEAERFVGRIAPDDFRTAAGGDEGSWQGVSLAGVPVIGGYARMHLADWRVAVGAPLVTVERSLRRALLLLTGGGLLLATVSGAFAIRLARTIARPLGELARAGAALGRGEVLPPIETGVREVALVASALRTASIALRSRTDALHAERTQLAAIIETVPVGLLIVEPDMTVISGNAQMAEITGRSAGLGPAMLDLRMADGSAVPSRAWPTGRALRGESNPELECRLHRPDGSSVWVYLIAAPIHGPDGSVTAAVVAALDIEEVVRARDEKARSAFELERQVGERTQQLEDANVRLRQEIGSRTEAESQLRQVQKMEAVGQLTGGIAHDFNNLLTIVIGCLDMLRRRAPDDRSRRLADNALDGAQRAATLTARLLAFSRQQPLAPRALDLNRLVDDMADLLRRTLGEHVALQTRLDPALWLVHADPNQLENVLLNLAVNSKDAVAALGGEDRGRLLVSTANVVLAEGAFVDVKAGEYACMTVADTGTGMPPEVIGRVFEPFFTTKPIGQGTGLGLSQVHGFVKQSGGHVEIASCLAPDAGHGTAVTLYLPREPVADCAPAPAAPQAAPDAAPGRGTILVVEDEPGVRSFACDALEELGYTVLGVGDVAGAIAVLDRAPEVALLFTDMVLPERSGRVLAAEARLRRPDLPILFTTGLANDRVLREGRLGPGEGLIEKPYTVSQLAHSVAALLEPHA